jgi:hypothetical protein
MKFARKVYVLGVGMTKFYKPGQKDYPELAKEAGEQALADAGVAYRDVEQAYVGYVYGESTSGQPRSRWPLRRSDRVLPSARSRSASKRWRRARSGRSTPIARCRSTTTSAS